MNDAAAQPDVNTFQGMIAVLQNYWAEQGCLIQQSYDMEMGAGTFHPSTFLRAIGPEPWFACHTQSSRRPTDGRYGDNPNRLQHYYQFQVAMKPSPEGMQDLYLGSLEALGFNTLEHDIRFWLNGMEVTQYTYFQQCGGISCKPVLGELAYGIERLAMYIQGVESVYDLVWGHTAEGVVSYGDVFHQNEVEQSAYNFEHADVDALFQQFDQCEKDCARLCELQLPLPAYEQVLRASHSFNLLDARHAISVTERQRYILKVRTLSRLVADAWLSKREALGFPLLKSNSTTEAANNV